MSPGASAGPLITPARHVARESGYVMDAAKERERGCSGVFIDGSGGRDGGGGSGGGGGYGSQLLFTHCVSPIFHFLTSPLAGGVTLAARLSQNSSSIVSATSFLRAKGKRKGKRRSF